MDPDAIVERASGTIDRTLLTGTGGGLLGRKVLADEPLLAHLEDCETLEYLLAGPAPPTRVTDGRRQAFEVSGSYRTLLAVTDDRLLLVAGSADGDRAVEFDYRGLDDVVARRGLLTDKVVLEEAAGPTWEVTVGSGSEVSAAAQYAAQRAAAAGSARPGVGEDADDGERLLDGAATAPDSSATIDSFLQDATASETVDRTPGEEFATGETPADGVGDDGGFPGAERGASTEADPEEGAGVGVDEDGGAGAGVDEDGGAGMDGDSDDGVGFGIAADDGVDVDAGRESSAGVDTARDDRDGVASVREDAADAPGIGPTAGVPSDGAGPTAGRTSDGVDPTGAPAPEGPLVRALFAAVVEEASMPSVEGYASGDVGRVVGDAEAHHQRMRDLLAAGELETARGAAATVIALAREGRRLADEQGDAEARRRLEQVRDATRGTLLDAALDVEDLSVLSGPEPAAMKALLQQVDPTAFEHLVADLWSELGYQTAVTQSSKDRGVDVVARQSTPVEQTVVIQAKRYGENTKVGREAVQQYASLHRQEPDADLVVVVTTSAFTGPARESSSELGVKLVDGDRLVEMLLDRECYELVARYA